VRGLSRYLRDIACRVRSGKRVATRSSRWILVFPVRETTHWMSCHDTGPDGLAGEVRRVAGGARGLDRGVFGPTGMASVPWAVCGIATVVTGRSPDPVRHVRSRNPRSRGTRCPSHIQEGSQTVDRQPQMPPTLSAQPGIVEANRRSMPYRGRGRNRELGIAQVKLPSLHDFRGPCVPPPIC
jgi:hypothetical protein